MRLYQNEYGILFPSVTTALGDMKKDSLDEWRARIGVEEANKIAHNAASIGTRLHLMCEKYLNNDPAYNRKAFPQEAELFRHMKPILDENVELVYGQEFPLYSLDLGVAGRCDMFCRYRGKPTIVDFKSSSKPKKKEWIENYFYQATAYAMMVMERQHLPVSNFAIIISSPEGVQVFEDRVIDWIERTRDYFKSYHARHGFSQEYFKSLIGDRSPDKKEE